MAVTNIPLTALSVGEHVYGPAAIADTDTLINLSIDRTVTGGFNSAPATTTALIYVYQSNDGGVTWTWIGGDQMTGGIYTSPKTGQENIDYIQVGLNPGTGRQAKASVTVSGASVAVAGTLTTS
jgi:hypothetical protein